MAKVIEDTECTNLTRDVNTIRNEQNKGGNTKTRIANMFQSIITYLNERNIEGGGGGISDLTGYSWWGRSFPTEGTDEQKKTLKGSLSGDIDFIQFSNGVKIGIDNEDSERRTLKIYKDGSTANIYATGGVSALGMSSSGGGGGGGGTDLGTFLSKLNSDNPNISQGYLYYNGNKFLMTAGGGGSGLTPGNLAEALDGEPVPTRAGYLYFNGSNYSWENSGGSSNLPIATNNRLGGIKVGNTLTINADTGVLNVAQMNIPKASTSVLGGIIVGSGLIITNQGVLSLDSNNITASKLGTGTVGSSTQPIYLSSGSPALCNKYAGGTAVTLNGSPKTADTASFWAPTSVGTQNYILKSNGSGAPVWTSQSSLTVGKADRLSGTGTYKVWGQTYWQDGGPKNVTGSMTSVGSITMSGYIYMDNNNGIGIKDTYSNHDYLTVLGFNGSNTLYIGYGTRRYGYQTDIQGGTITFATNNGSTGNVDSRLEVGEFSANGLFYVKQGDRGVRIGNGILSWDSTNNALKVQKADGTPANFYATGGVSALGMSAGTSSIDSMTFNYLTVNNNLTVKNSITIGSDNPSSIYNNLQGVLIINGNEGVEINCPTTINENLNVTGYLTAPRFYFDIDDTTKQYYFFMSGSTLKFYSNGQTKTVSLV